LPYFVTTKRLATMKKVMTKEPITPEAFNRLFDQYVQHMTEKHHLPKWVQSDLKPLSKRTSLKWPASKG
jgi:ribosomal protein L16 Arg81 hydroxylase